MVSCNKDDVLSSQLPPKIEIDSETGIYTIKIGRQLTIAPAYESVDGAMYTWTIDGHIASTSPILDYTAKELGSHFVNLRVDTEHGFAREELRIDVLELTPPIVSILVPAQGLKVKFNTDYTITPDIQHEDLGDFSIRWERNGKVVCTEKSYIFNESALGKHDISIFASNEDGTTEYDITIEVLAQDPYGVSFPKPYYNAEENIRYTYPENSVYLRPHLEYFQTPSFSWYVNGEKIPSATNQTFAFTPNTPGEYEVLVSVKETDTSPTAESKNIRRGATTVNTTVKVVCVSGTPKDRFRPMTAVGSKYCNKVYDFTPAPGQFINETMGTNGYSGNETTMELACAFAERQLAANKYVSLGAWGGYLIAGFDHSITKKNGKDYDFAIQGNAFGTSNEPGVVWVMQDVNGNGLPDDEWYELRGSETGKKTTIQDYEVTYFRPEPYAMKNRWIDCFGKEGSVGRNVYHAQKYYYPVWMPDSYTIRGTLIPGTMSNEGHAPYPWGYVDNIGNDSFNGDAYNGEAQMNGFKISNAIYPDGTPIHLEYIDFVKIQCAVMEYHSSFGEVSTEVFSIEDL